MVLIVAGHTFHPIETEQELIRGAFAPLLQGERNYFGVLGAYHPPFDNSPHHIARTLSGLEGGLPRRPVHVYLFDAQSKTASARVDDNIGAHISRLAEHSAERFPFMASLLEKLLQFHDQVKPNAMFGAGDPYEHLEHHAKFMQTLPQTLRTLATMSAYLQRWPFGEEQRPKVRWLRGLYARGAPHYIPRYPPVPIYNPEKKQAWRETVRCGLGLLQHGGKFVILLSERRSDSAPDPERFRQWATETIASAAAENSARLEYYLLTGAYPYQRLGAHHYPLAFVLTKA